MRSMAGLFHLSHPPRITAGNPATPTNDNQGGRQCLAPFLFCDLHIICIQLYVLQYSEILLLIIRIEIKTPGDDFRGLIWRFVTFYFLLPGLTALTNVIVSSGGTTDQSYLYS